jgi:hypothetical protein
MVLSLLAACGSDSRTVPGATDAAAQATGEVNSRTPDEESRAVGQLDCEDASRPETGLQLIPEFVTAFRHVDAECEPLPARFLLNNTQASPVQVDGARTSSKFSVDPLELPLDLLPGESTSIQIRYLGDALDSEEGTLTVSTSSGCSDFPVLGLATDGGLMTYSDLAIDFGATRAGSVSGPREFVVAYQRAAAFPGTIFDGFSAAPSDTFQVIGAPDGRQSLESCDEIHFQIRFRAPQTLGRTEGALSWSATTQADNGTYEGLAFVPLYGTAVAD